MLFHFREGVKDGDKKQFFQYKIFCEKEIFFQNEISKNITAHTM